MSSIQETVSSILRSAGLSSYLPQAEPVILALVERERKITEQLIDYAADAGLNLDEVRTYLREAGLSMPSDLYPQTVQAPADPETDQALARIEGLLSAMARQVQSLTEFAQANGYRG